MLPNGTENDSKMLLLWTLGALLHPGCAKPAKTMPNGAQGVPPETLFGSPRLPERRHKPLKYDKKHHLGRGARKSREKRLNRRPPPPQKVGFRTRGVSNSTSTTISRKTSQKGPKMSPKGSLLAAAGPKRTPKDLQEKNTRNETPFNTIQGPGACKSAGA